MEVKIKELITILESIAPLYLQEEYDNSGLQTGDPDCYSTGMLLALDVTEQVIDEAIAVGCNLIVAHHPLIFKPLKRLSEADPVTRCLLKAIRHNIAIYAIHTNIDNAWQGLNFALAGALGIAQVQVLKTARGNLNKLITYCPKHSAEKVREALFEAGAGHIGNYDGCSFNLEGTGTFKALEGADPYVGKHHELHFEDEVRIEVVVPVGIAGEVIKAMHHAHPYEEVAYDLYPLINGDPYAGSGAYGLLAEPLSVNSFLGMIKSSLGTPWLRYAGGGEGMIRKVGVCGGSGAFMLEQANRLKLDALVTADVKYHQFGDAAERILLVDAGHYETEIMVTRLISDQIQKKIPNFACRITTCNTNPVKYL